MGINVKSSRETALLILYKVEYEGAYPNLELKNSIPTDMDQRDRAFVTNIVYGVINKKLTLDYAIEQYSKVKLKKLSKYIHQILRMGIYQILFMDKVPDNAAVNESVKLSRRYGHKASSGYVNGLLRNVARNGIKYPTEKIKRLSVMYSFPEWICEKWTEDFGYEFTEEMMKAFDKEPELTLRPNNLKITAKELAEKLTENGAEARVEENAVICKSLNIASDELYKNGMYTVQDKAAMAAVNYLAPQKGETVIDMCAAPGGKTTHIAEMMENRGRVIAFDVYEHKIKLVKENAQRLGLDIIEVSIADASKYCGSLECTADRILCDVPCSGLGIIRRKPDIKWNRKCGGELPALQAAILKNASRYLKPGGYILYSTCTVEHEENEGVTSQFLEENSGFEKIFEKTFYPHIDGTDGFYICKMRKLND